VGLVVAVLLWGTLHPLGKIALRSLEPQQFAAIRALCAGLVLLGLCALTGRLSALQAELRRPLAAVSLGLIGFAASNAASMAALGMLPAGVNAVLANSSPLLAVAAAPLLGERPGWLGLVGVILGFVGVAFLAEAGPGGEALPLLGVALSLSGAAAWAIYTLIGRRVGARRDPVALTTLAAFVGAVPLLFSVGPGALASTLLASGPMVWLLVLWCGGACMGVTYALWAGALRRLPASRVAPAQYLIPPLGVLFAWALLGEQPTPTQVLGTALIVAGVAVVQRPRRSSD
jgi:drug/metabolite transporter (DMT)-like permease